MANGTENFAIAVTLNNGTLTVAESPCVLAPTGNFTVTWTLTGGTFPLTNFFQWGCSIAPAAPVVQLPTLDATRTIITLKVDVGYLNAAPFSWWYELTASGGTVTAASCLMLASAWAYPDQYSYFPGDTIQLHVASNAPYLTLSLYPLTSYSQNSAGNEQWTAAPLSTQVVSTALPSALFGPANSGQIGNVDWEWPANVQLPTQASWPGGIYIAELAAFASEGSTLAVTTSWVMFVLKNPKPQPGYRMLYKWNINTIQAYSLALYPYVVAPGFPANELPVFPYDNSLYGNPAPPPGAAAGTTSAQVTLRRPTGQMWSVKAAIYDFPFVMWLNAQGIEVDYCTDVDVELDTELTMLANYPAVIFRGHDEYLGSATYQNLTNYRNAGGNIAFLCGNTCCWRVWYGSDVNGVPTSFTCDKGPPAIHLDVNGPDAWWKLDPNDSALVGAGSRNAAITGAAPTPFYDAGTPYLLPSSGFTVSNADHWIYSGSGVSNGSVIGNEPPFGPPAGVIENLIGYEANGIALNASLQPTGVDHAPPNFVILGIGVTGGLDGSQVSPSLNGSESNAWLAFSREGAVQPQPPNPPYAATMGMYSSYGSVFTGSTVNWVFILNEMNANGWVGAWPASFPPGWPPHGYLGNPVLHHVATNVFNAFANAGRTLAGAVDLNGDAQPDLVFQSDGTGEVSYWLMTNGTARAASGSVLYDGTSAPGQTLRVAAAGSLATTGGGIFLQATSNGAVYYWQTAFSGSSVTRQSVQQIAGDDAPGAPWKLCTVMSSGTPGTVYLLFQHQQNGSLWYWELQGTARIASAAFVNAWQPGNLQWVLAGALDLNGDGVTEVVFQNPTTGAVQYWTMNGVTKTGEGSISNIASSPGILAAAGNFGPTAQPLLIFQSGTDGSLSYVGISGFAAGTPSPFTPTSNPYFLGPPVTQRT